MNKISKLEYKRVNLKILNLALTALLDKIVVADHFQNELILQYLNTFHILKTISVD